MTISVQVTNSNYTGNGSTTVFPYTFTVITQTDLLVYLDGVAQSTGFSVSGVGVAGGGSVTFTAAPTIGQVVRLERSVPQNRTTDYQNGGALDANVLDADFDRTIMMVQDLSNQAIRTTGGNINVTTQRIMNLGAPVVSTDAATKLYVDTTVTRLGNLTVPVSGTDDNKFLRANTGAASWQTLTAASPVNGTDNGSILTANAGSTSWQPSPIGFKNKIINGGFRVNQRAVSGSVVLTVGNYGLDRWKAGASGCTFTFATVNCNCQWCYYFNHHSWNFNSSYRSR
jgi:hypothetical protein